MGSPHVPSHAASPRRLASLQVKSTSSPSYLIRNNGPANQKINLSEHVFQYKLTVNVASRARNEAGTCPPFSPRWPLSEVPRSSSVALTYSGITWQAQHSPFTASVPRKTRHVPCNEVLQKSQGFEPQLFPVFPLDFRALFFQYLAVRQQGTIVVILPLHAARSHASHQVWK